MKIVRQGDAQVKSSQKSAFPIALVVAVIMRRFSDINQIIFGNFYLACSYTAPIYIKKLPSQSEQEYQAAVGYQEGETEDVYLERMTGTSALFAAILQAYDLGYAWTYVARLVNVKPRRATASILYPFLQIASYEMSQRYRRQYTKLLIFIKTTFLPKLSTGSPTEGWISGPRDRIELFLNEWESNGCVVQMPEGKVLPPS